MSLYESLQHITPRRLREGRMPFVFYSGVVLLIVIALIADSVNFMAAFMFSISAKS
jgi:hypothetical protein